MATKYIGSVRLTGQLAIVTGASQGLGLMTAKVLAAMGADVVMAVRDMDRGSTVVAKEIKPFFMQHSGELMPTVKALPLDLASFQSVRSFVDGVQQAFPGRAPSLLVNNAGLMMKKRTVTEDGNELLLQVNYLSPVLLSLLTLRDCVLPVVGKGASSSSMRIVNLSTGYHTKAQLNMADLQSTQGYENMKTYCQAKLALTTFSNFMQKTYDGESSDPSLKFLQQLKSHHLDLRTVSVDPGYIKTQLVRQEHGFTDQDIQKLMGAARMTLDQGAATTIAACVKDDIVGGSYMARERVAKEKDTVRDPQVQQQLWEQTKQLVQWS